MNSRLRIPLTSSADQAQRLAALQAKFAEACNLLAPLAAQQRCWNRVALHHLSYRLLRERFPELGSQMACNAIYSVSRTCRVVYQHPASPFHVVRWGARELPVLRFLPVSPVYFDRHTLSLKAGRVSMFTLDGRMHFELGLAPRDEQRFREDKLREIVLSREGERFVLTFAFGAAPEPALERRATAEAQAEWPEYVLVQEPVTVPTNAETLAPEAPPANRPAPALSQPLTPMLR